MRLRNFDWPHLAPLIPQLHSLLTKVTEAQTGWTRDNEAIDVTLKWQR